jgi:hypothetical protein
MNSRRRVNSTVGFLLICMMKVVSAIIILFVAGFLVAQGQQTETWGLSGADKSDIIEAVLNLGGKNPASIPPYFPNIRTVSSANIEFIDSARLQKHGFTVVTSSQINEGKKDYVIDYLVFKKIQFQLLDGVARVVVWRVSEGRPCFSAPLPPAITIYTYECRRTSTGWEAQLIGVPSPPMPFASRK